MPPALRDGVFAAGAVGVGDGWLVLHLFVERTRLLAVGVALMLIAQLFDPVQRRTRLK